MKIRQLYWESKHFRYKLPYQDKMLHTECWLEARMFRIDHSAFHQLFILWMKIPEVDDPEEWQVKVYHIDKWTDALAIREAIRLIDLRMGLIKMQIEEIENMCGG